MCERQDIQVCVSAEHNRSTVYDFLLLNFKRSHQGHESAEEFSLGQ